MSKQILSFIKNNGPTLPVKISTLVGVDIITASAMLSELVSNNELKLTFLKIGNSPLYYIPNQEEELDNYLDRLHEKEKPVCEFLKQKSVLRDKNLNPFQQIALKNSKDFAKPLNVKVDGIKELFWKWHMLSSDDTRDFIRKELRHKEFKEKNKKFVEERIERQENLEEIKKTNNKFIKPGKNVSEEFYDKICGVFNSDGITIFDKEVLRKNLDLDLIVKIPSPIGELKYYVKARNKKLCNDQDLSSAYVQGQTRNLPVLFIHTGKLTKKAKSMLDNEFKHITIKKI